MYDSESDLTNPEENLKSVFRKQILSFPSLLIDDDFEKAVEDSFANLPSPFFNEVDTLRMPKSDSQEKWLQMFKANYHKYVAENLLNPSFRSAIIVSFAKLDDTCRDYLTWHYENAFSPEQITAITGQSLLSVRKKIWIYRKQLQEVFAGCNASFSIAPSDEERFQRLTFYFDHTLPLSEAMENVIWLSNSNADIQRSDIFELLLRQGIRIEETPKNHDINNRNAYLSADTFLQYAKAKIQQHNNSIP